jgi:hypothetical protein
VDEPEAPHGELEHAERVRLEALRYTARDEAPTYIAILRTFTGEIAGLLSDQSAVEVAQRLSEQGFELSADTVDDRLSYLQGRRAARPAPRGRCTPQAQPEAPHELGRPSRVRRADPTATQGTARPSPGHPGHGPTVAPPPDRQEVDLPEPVRPPAHPPTHPPMTRSPR